MHLKQFCNNTGEVVGALSFSVGHGANMLRKVASVRMFHQAHESQNLVSYPLKRKVIFHPSFFLLVLSTFLVLANWLHTHLLVVGLCFLTYLLCISQVQHNNLDEVHDCGCLLVSTACFERKTTPNYQRDMEAKNVVDRDIGFWIGLGPQATWEGIRSLLPLSVVPKPLQNDFVAMEVVMKNGKKHAIFRSLATLVNESDVKLDISICHVSLLLGANSNVVVEERFQNQRFQPGSGWGNSWSGFGSVEPGPWSSRDFTNSSKVSVLTG